MLSLYSWNVNGIRAVINKGSWSEFMLNEHPDIICLQEIKARPEQITFDHARYWSHWHPAQRPGYSGVALIAKQQPLQVNDGLPDLIIKTYRLHTDTYGDPTQEGRVVSAEYPNFWLVNVYTPNAKEDLSRIPLRLKHWDPAFLAYLKQLEKTKPVIVCGDFNVAHTPDDLANPGPNEGKKGFTSEERSGFQALIDAGFIDSFRLFHQGNGFYTWWSHFANARTRNVGWRIDYFLVSETLKSHVIAADIHPDILGSDHCPISLTLDF